ncbi:MAG: TM2 domain-containing protein [Gemmatimonadales bacterium]
MTEPYYPAEQDPYRSEVVAREALSRSKPSERSRSVAVALGFITGVFGGHRYYAGKIRTGLLMTFTFGGMGIWWLVDMIMLVTGEFRDVDGRRITNWSPADFAPPGGVTVEQLEALRAEVDAMRHELMDVHERIDFQERMLQRGRTP